MSLWNKTELLAALEGELLEHNLLDEILVDEVVIDSRKAKNNSLFIALKGEKNDGHNFLSQVSDNGCKIAIIDNLQLFNDLRLTTDKPKTATTYDLEPKTYDLRLTTDKTKITTTYDLRLTTDKPKTATTYDLRLTTYDLQLILVKNTFTALYKLAEFSRQRSKAKIMAVTGSVGKTSVKEMLKIVFSSQGKTFATQGNLNNHFGLPLSLANFARDCEFGIFEMGMNHAGEIEPLSKLARPHLALITTVGPVHIEFFANEEGIAAAKAEIFSGLEKSGFALINRDNHHFNFLAQRANNYQMITFGKENPANYQIISYHNTSPFSSIVKAKIKSGKEVSYKINSANSAQIFNSIIIVACLDLLGKNLELGLNALQDFENEKGRGSLTDLDFGQKTIATIDDSYNASVPSMCAGIEHAANLKHILNKKRLVIALGDMLELGEKSVELHAKVIDFLITQKPDLVILIGKEMSNQSNKLPSIAVKTFLNSELAATEINGLLNDDDLLYIKGSRGIKMEKLIAGAKKLN